MSTDYPPNGGGVVTIKEEEYDGDGGSAQNNGNGNHQFQHAPPNMDNNNSNPNPRPNSAEENTNGGGSAVRSDICRDYLNNVCFRGNRCRFYHPPEASATRDHGKEVIKDFCHDYQNKGCTRESCRYIHCNREDMEEYNRSGKVTESLAKALVAVTGQEVVDGRPLCKEFLSGKCSRGSRCRFWHINPRMERERRSMERVSSGGGGIGGGGGYGSGGGGGRGGPPRGGGRGPIPPMPATSYGGGGGVPAGGYGGGGYESAYDYGAPHPPEYKRPRLDEDQGAVAFGGSSAGQAPSQAAYMALQEENIALRRKIDVLKQTVAELSAANDNMVAENNRLRASLQVPSVGGPAVNDPSIVGNMAAATALSGVLNSVSQTLAGQTASQSAGMPALAADHLAVSLAAAAQQTMAAAAQSMAMSATSDNVHWSVMRRQ